MLTLYSKIQTRKYEVYGHNKGAFKYYETNRKYESSITPDETPLTLGKRINQSETELKIQKQNRVRALIRNRLEQENIVRERVEQKNIITNRLERENKLEQQNIIKQRQGQDYCSADREEKENITDKLEQKNLSTNRLDQENISTNRLEQGKISKNWQEQEKEVPRYSSQITEFLDKERDMDLLGSEQLDNEENDDILLTTSSSEQIISENEKKSLSKSTEFSPPVAEEKQKCETVLVSDAQKTGTELEEEFYSLLDKLVTDLNTHRHTGSVVTEEENMMEREDALVYIMEKENGVKNLEEEITTLYSECSQDASTQTDRIKRSRKCQIM